MLCEGSEPRAGGGTTKPRYWFSGGSRKRLAAIAARSAGEACVGPAPGRPAGPSLRRAARRRSIRLHPKGRVVLVLATNSASSSGLGGGTSGFLVDMASRAPRVAERHKMGTAAPVQEGSRGPTEKEGSVDVSAQKCQRVCALCHAPIPPGVPPRPTLKQPHALPLEMPMEGRGGTTGCS